MILIPFDHILGEFWSELFRTRSGELFEEYVQYLNKSYNIKIIYRYSDVYGYEVKGIECANEEDAITFKLKWSK